MSVVLAQPHRLGNTDQRCENALGRFCMAQGLRRELYDAGQDFATLTASFRAAKIGTPSHMTSDAVGTGKGPSDETVAAWGQTLIRVNAAMQTQNPEGYYAVRAMCLEDRAPDILQEGYAVEGLVILARELGKLRSGDVHPFNKSA